MTEDITSLQIKILYDSVTEAERRLKALEGTAGKAERAIKGKEKAAGSLMGTLTKLAAGYITLNGVVAGFRAIIRTTAEFQQLNAQLVTATGSAKNAAVAFAAIKDFAASTPYDLQQATGAFISLVNRGLEPSERALRAYGDMASSMGAQLSDMVLAVANATAGEYETLKRFGVRAQKEGDNVKFTFRGVTTEVKNNIQEIQKYFIELSENSFGGGMERQMKTLTGAFSNVGDAWEVMLSTIGKKGLGDLVEKNVRQAEALIVEFTAMLESGQVGAVFDSWGIAFEGYVEGVTEGFSYINTLLVEHGDQGQESGMTLSEGLIGGIKAVVAAYPAYVGSMATILWGIVDSAVQVGKAIYETIAASFNALINAAWNTGAAIGNALNPFSDKSAKQGFVEAWEGAKNDISNAANDSRKAWEQSFAKIGINAQVVTGNIAQEWETVGDRINRATMVEAEANQKRAEWDAKAAERAKQREDRLKQFGLGLTEFGTLAEGSIAAIEAELAKTNAELEKLPVGSERFNELAAKARKAQAALAEARNQLSPAKNGGGGGGGGGASEWETLERSLREQETMISESYARRLALIEANTRDGSAYQAELALSLTEKFQEEQERRVDAMKKEPETLFLAYEEENRIIEEAYARRKDIILNATELTETEKLRMLKEAEELYTAQMRKHETERNKVQLGLAADFFGNISQMASAFGRRGSKIAKAAAIAQTTIKTYESATSAYAALAGIPYVGPALGAAAAGAAIAAGLANVAAIKAQDDSGGYAGAYATGGVIPAGKFGLVGEAGPEFVQGPAMVTSASSTADRLANPAGGGANVQVNIVNMSGEPVTEKRSKQGDKEMIEFIIGQAKTGVADDIKKGGTPVSRALEGTYNLGRGRRA